MASLYCSNIVGQSSAKTPCQNGKKVLKIGFPLKSLETQSVA